MDNWHERFKTMKKELGLTNSDIADITGNSADSGLNPCFCGTYLLS